VSFLGQDWSFGNFKNKGAGLLSDPNQMLTNPWVQMGMGLLSENTKPGGGDPFGGAMQGLAGAKKTKQEDEDRKRLEVLRAKLAALIAAQAQAGQQSPGAPPGVMSPQGGMMTPVPPQQPRSIMDLLRTSGK